MALTTEQVLLLENLTYTYDNDFPYNNMENYQGMTVGDFINSIDTAALAEEGANGSYMTGEDWVNIINAVKNDPELMSMTIAETHVDTAGEGAFSVVFLDNSTNEAVVAFKGTEGSGEWEDNFAGGTSTDAADGVSTPCQESALEWYKEVYDKYDLDDYYVTVTGHSKGGNKAKYITILDDSVDRCLSFDGQGFSDEFIDKYNDQIAANQSKIQNHNVDNDYVNILLNDVGETTYYKGQRIGNGGGSVLENHCPDSFFSYDEDGNPVMTEGEQGELLIGIDDFFNSLLRSMDPSMRKQALTLVNDILHGVLNGKGVNYFLDLLTSPANLAAAAFIISYLVLYVDDKLLRALFDAIAEYLRTVFGMDITGDDIYALYKKLTNLPIFRNLTITPVSGADKKVSSIAGNHTITADTELMNNMLSEINSLNTQVQNVAAEMASIHFDSFTMRLVFGGKVSKQSKQMEKYANSLQSLYQALENICELYDNAENKNMSIQ